MKCRWRGALLVAIFFLLPGLRPLAAEGPRAVFGLGSRCEKGADGKGRVRVDALTPGGPADRAGLKLGDRILSLDGKGLCSSNDLEFMRYLAVFEAGTPIQAEVLRGQQLLRFTLVPGPASAEHLAGSAKWMEKLRLCFEEGICEPCMAPSESCAAQTDEMRILEAAEELDLMVKSRPEGVIFDLDRDHQGKISISSPEIEIPSGFDPQRHRLLAPRLPDLQNGQAMRLRLIIREGSRDRIQILELPHPVAGGPASGGSADPRQLRDSNPAGF